MSTGSTHSVNEPLLAGLDSAQQQRLTELLDEYLRAQERGLPLDQNSLLAANPDLAHALRAYFCSLNELHGLAAGFAATAQSDTPQITSGRERLGDFELIREIGRGGMGVVYEARQLSLDRRVAVKLLPFAAILDARQIARFKHEAHAAAQLHHSHIVPVFAVGVERGVHYYAMQYIDGQPLDVAIAGLKSEFKAPSSRFKVSDSSTLNFEPGTLNPTASPDTTPHAFLSTRRPSDTRDFFRQVAELGVQAAEALASAHEHGVIHRDIKPSNLLLETGGKLWVTDFGLARFQRDVSLTRTGDLVGTLRYMSPEQAAGKAALIDHRTDIYSLGATLYELACLQPAFGDQGGPALLQQIATREPTPPRQLRPAMPVDLETVILKAMSKEREGRYEGAQQLADDLRCVAEGRPTRARPPAFAERAWRWARRRQRSLAATACLTLLAAAGTYASALLIARERTQAGSEIVRMGALKTKAAAENIVLRRNSALSYNKLAATHSQLHEAEAARNCYYQAIKLQQDLLRASPANCDVQHDLAVSLNNLSLLLSRANRLDEAEAALRQSLELQATLVRQQPGAAALASDLGGTWCNLGILLEKRGQLNLASEAFTQALRHQQAAATLSPESPRFREMLSQHQGHQARVVRAQQSAASSQTNLVTPPGREL